MAHDMQVEIEGDSLQQPSATSAEQQSMLGLGQTEVVNGSQQVTLEAPLTDQPLVQGEGRRRPGVAYHRQAYQVQSQGPWTRASVWIKLLTFLLESQPNVYQVTQMTTK